jgi:hypothetical protein
MLLKTFHKNVEEDNFKGQMMKIFCSGIFDIEEYIYTVLHIFYKVMLFFSSHTIRLS